MWMIETKDKKRSSELRLCVVGLANEFYLNSPGHADRYCTLSLLIIVNHAFCTLNNRFVNNN